eukprot:m.128653 g.128653  ORF g.128653 m.128653 type:complete len:402 (+) comp13633_c0_seq1:278-1483(+)
MSARAVKRTRCDPTPDAAGYGRMPLLPHNMGGNRPINVPSAVAAPADPEPARGRPRGRPPKGMAWNTALGVYEPTPPSIGPDGTVNKVKPRPDPKKPKRAMSSFLYYAKTVRPALIKGGLKFVEAQKQMAADWKAMTKEQRQPFEDIAEGERQRYKRQMLTYVPPATAMPQPTQGKAAKPASGFSALDSYLPAAPARSKDKPKRPPSSFLLYCQENRERVKQQVATTHGAQMQEVQRRLADEWKALPTSSKQQYLDKQTHLTQEFRKEKEVWQDSVGPSLTHDASQGHAMGMSSVDGLHGAVHSHQSGPFSVQQPPTQPAPVAPATDAGAYADQLSTYHDLLALQYYQALQRIQALPNPQDVPEALQQEVMSYYQQLVEVSGMMQGLPQQTSSEEHTSQYF